MVARSLCQWKSWIKLQAKILIQPTFRPRMISHDSIPNPNPNFNPNCNSGSLVVVMVVVLQAKNLDPTNIQTTYDVNSLSCVTVNHNLFISICLCQFSWKTCPMHPQTWQCIWELFVPFCMWMRWVRGQLPFLHSEHHENCSIIFLMSQETPVLWEFRGKLEIFTTHSVVCQNSVANLVACLSKKLKFSAYFFSPQCHWCECMLKCIQRNVTELNWSPLSLRENVVPSLFSKRKGFLHFWETGGGTVIDLNLSVTIFVIIFIPNNRRHNPFLWLIYSKLNFRWGAYNTPRPFSRLGKGHLLSRHQRLWCRLLVKFLSFFSTIEALPISQFSSVQLSRCVQCV